MYQLPYYQLPITNYQLPITNYQLLPIITNYQLPIAIDCDYMSSTITCLPKDADNVVYF